MIAGCSDFVTGAATGALAAQKLAEDAQTDFIEAVIAVNAETRELNAGLEELVKPETKQALESIKDKAKEPVWWIALASLLAGGSGVNLWKNKKAGEK